MAISGSIPMPVNPVTIKTLMFEYTEKAYGLTTGSLVSGSGSEELLKEGRIPSSQVNNGKVLAKAIPKTMFQGLNSETTPSKSEFVNEIAKILKNVMLVVRGESTEKLTETQVNMLILTAVRGMTTLESVQEIEILYTTLVNGLNKDQSETMRQLFLDTVVMTGTPHSVEFFEKMVREGKATTHEINSFFMFLPRYIMTPTQQVLKRLFKLVTEVESIKTVPTTYSLAMTGLTSWSTPPALLRTGRPPTQSMSSVSSAPQSPRLSRRSSSHTWPVPFPRPQPLSWRRTSATSTPCPLACSVTRMSSLS